MSIMAVKCALRGYHSWYRVPFVPGYWIHCTTCGSVRNIK